MPKTIYGYQKRPPVVGTVNNDASLTQQHFANEVNINNIMRKYEQTGFLTDPTKRATRQAVFNSVADQNMTYHEMIIRIDEINEQFDSVPAHVRKRFHNNPGEFLQFFADPSNKEEAQKLGLIPSLKEEHIASVRIVEDPPAGLPSEPTKATKKTPAPLST